MYYIIKIEEATHFSGELILNIFTKEKKNGGSFTPLVMTALGGMGREASKFYSRLSESIAEKRKERYSVIKNWISRKI